MKGKASYCLHSKFKIIYNSCNANAVELITNGSTINSTIKSFIKKLISAVSNSFSFLSNHPEPAYYQTDHSQVP